jgi:hypothetical protein
MTDAELKRIHGDDVELAPDDSEDEHLSEADAIKQAKKEGIEFVDHFMIAGHEDLGKFDTKKLAEKEASKLKGEINIIQVREKKQ